MSIFLFVAFVVTGFDIVIEGSKFARDSTEEDCAITGYETNTCTYDCNCNGDRCYDTCNGTKWQHTTIIQSKCGNATIYENPDDIECDEGNSASHKYDMGTEHTCYVLECADEEFSFISGSSMISQGIIFLICSFVCFPLCWMGIWRQWFGDCGEFLTNNSANEKSRGSGCRCGSPLQGAC